MLTNDDIKKLVEVFATREEVALKSDLEDLKQDFRVLQSAVDGFAQKADAYFQEMLLLAHRVDRLEKWVQRLAEKTGVKLDY